MNKLKLLRVVALQANIHREERLAKHSPFGDHCGSLSDM